MNLDAPLYQSLHKTIQNPILIIDKIDLHTYADYKELFIKFKLSSKEFIIFDKVHIEITIRKFSLFIKINYQTYKISLNLLQKLLEIIDNKIPLDQKRSIKLLKMYLKTGLKEFY